MNTYDLVSCQTRIYQVVNYLDRAHDFYKQRYMVGPHEVVGTPYLARTSLYQEFPFNERMLNSDDTEFCQRLIDHSKRIYRTADICYEIGFNTLPNIVERWLRWGRGDALFYNTMKHRWNLWRKIQSWCHPLDVELAVPFKILPLWQFLYTLPLLVLVVILRYLGWFKYCLLKR